MKYFQDFWKLSCGLLVEFVFTEKILRLSFLFCLIQQ